MQVAFWSLVHGQVATTSNTLAIAAMIALEYRLKILLAHNHFSRSTLENTLLDKEYLNSNLTMLSDTGVDALSRYIKYNSVDKDKFKNYTTMILKNRLDLLMGTNNANKEVYINDSDQVLESILNSADKYYDLILIDTASGENALSKMIIEKADLVVICLNQNINVLEDFFESGMCTDKKCLYVVGMYDESSRYNLNTIKRKYKLKDNIVSVPYCREFSDACNEGKAINFFMRNLEVTRKDNNYKFINGVRNSACQLLKELEYNIDVKKLGD